MKTKSNFIDAVNNTYDKRYIRLEKVSATVCFTSSTSGSFRGSFNEEAIGDLEGDVNLFSIKLINDEALALWEYYQNNKDVIVLLDK